MKENEEIKLFDTENMFIKEEFVLSNGKKHAIMHKKGEDVTSEIFKSDVYERVKNNDIFVNEIIKYYKLDEGEDLITRTLCNNEEIHYAIKYENLIDYIDSKLKEKLDIKKYGEQLVNNYSKAQYYSTLFSNRVIAAHYNSKTDNISFCAIDLSNSESVNSILGSCDGKGICITLNYIRYVILLSNQNYDLLVVRHKDTDPFYENIKIDDMRAVDYITGLL